MNRCLYTPEFETFWNEYPSYRRFEKEYAFRKFKIALTRVGLDKILEALKGYKSFIIRNKTEQQFVKHPGVWLNKGCYMDDYGPIISEQKFELKKKALDWFNSKGYVPYNWKEYLPEDIGGKLNVKVIGNMTVWAL